MTQTLDITDPASWAIAQSDEDDVLYVTLRAPQKPSLRLTIYPGGGVTATRAIWCWRGVRTHILQIAEAASA